MQAVKYKLRKIERARLKRVIKNDWPMWFLRLRLYCLYIIVFFITGFLAKVMWLLNDVRFSALGDRVLWILVCMAYLFFCAHVFFVMKKAVTEQENAYNGIIDPKVIEYAQNKIKKYDELIALHESKHQPA